MLLLTQETRIQIDVRVSDPFWRKMLLKEDEKDILKLTIVVSIDIVVVVIIIVITVIIVTIVIFEVVEVIVTVVFWFFSIVVVVLSSLSQSISRIIQWIASIATSICTWGGERAFLRRRLASQHGTNPVIVMDWQTLNSCCLVLSDPFMRNSKTWASASYLASTFWDKNLLSHAIWNLLLRIYLLKLHDNECHRNGKWRKEVS